MGGTRVEITARLRQGSAITLTATMFSQWTADSSELLEGPPFGGPSLSMDPEGRIRTGISAPARPAGFGLVSVA